MALNSCQFLQSILKGDLKKAPGTFMGSDFDLSKYISQSPSNMASIETARRNLGAGDVEMYMPAKITAVECHVEFQVVSCFSLIFPTFLFILY